MASGRRRHASEGSGKIWRVVAIAALLLTLPVVALLLLLFRGGGDEDEGPPKAAITTIRHVLKKGLGRVFRAMS